MGIVKLRETLETPNRNAFADETVAQLEKIISGLRAVPVDVEIKVD